MKNQEIISINQDEFVGKPLKPFFWGKNPDGTWDPYVIFSFLWPDH